MLVAPPTILIPRYSKDKSGEKQLRILCAYDSADLRALLGEVLCRAGYNAVTTGNVYDAQILLKATKAKLIVLGANMQSVHGASTKKAMEQIDPAVSLLVLDEDFAAQDPGEGVTKLLEAIRSRTPGISSTREPWLTSGWRPGADSLQRRHRPHWESRFSHQAKVEKMCPRNFASSQGTQVIRSLLRAM